MPAAWEIAFASQGAPNREVGRAVSPDVGHGRVGKPDLQAGLFPVAAIRGSFGGCDADDHVKAGGHLADARFANRREIDENQLAIERVAEFAEDAVVAV